MIAAFLALHIGGAVVFVGFIGLALYQILIGCGNKRRMKYAAVSIGAYQILTGLVLALISPATGIVAVCVRGLVLVVVLYALSAVLSYRLPDPVLERSRSTL